MRVTVSEERKIIDINLSVNSDVKSYNKSLDECSFSDGGHRSYKRMHIAQMQDFITQFN